MGRERASAVMARGDAISCVVCGMGVARWRCLVVVPKELGKLWTAVANDVDDIRRSLSGLRQ